MRKMRGHAGWVRPSRVRPAVHARYQTPPVQSPSRPATGPALLPATAPASRLSLWQCGPQVAPPPLSIGNRSGIAAADQPSFDPKRPGHPPAAPLGCLCLADRGGPARRQHQSSRIRPGLVQRRHQRDAARTVHSHRSGLPHARRGRAPASSPLLGHFAGKRKGQGRHWDRSGRSELDWGHFAGKFDAQGPARGVAAAQAPIHRRPGASADPGGPAGAPGPSCGDLREKQPRLQVASQPRVRP